MNPQEGESMLRNQMRRVLGASTVGLYGMMSFRNDHWGAFCAGAVLTALPVMLIFLYAQKHIVTGLFAGSVK